MTNDKCDLLIKNAEYLAEDMTLAKGDIAIRDGQYVALGENTGYSADTELDGSGHLWMPGLYDGHTHTAQQLLRGRLLDEKPVIWKRINVPFESKLTPETSTLSAQVAALEMIKSGTVGFVDAGGKYVPEFAEVYRQSGLRGRLTYMTNDNPGQPDALRVTVQQGVDRIVELDKTLGRDGLLRAYFSVTALTAASEELIRAVFSEAVRRDMPATVHMNEYASEVFDFIGKYGVRPFEFMAAENLMPKGLVTPHCIFLSENEIDILKARDVRVMHCPFSNCGKGIPKTPQLLGRGIKVGFGSDGSAHGGTDLFKEMRLFRGVMNAHHGVNSADPQIMPAATLLKMATQGGASAMMEEGLGAIKPGYKADLIALNMMQPHLTPTANKTNTLVESACGSDVAHMVIHGRLVMKNRQVLTLDEEKILYEAARYAEGQAH